MNLINKKNIKHCYLRIKDNNTLEIKANSYFNMYDAIDLIQRKKDWILKNINKKQKNSLESNKFLFLGKKREKSDGFDVENFYRFQIEKIIYPLVNTFSKQMQLYPTSIKFRKNKNTWGSCNYKNGLNFNILLCKFPLEVIEYVVIHELAHIKHKNHSKEFWNLVEKYCPDYNHRVKVFKSYL